MIGRTRVGYFGIDRIFAWWEGDKKKRDKGMEKKRKEKGGVSGQNGAPERSEDLRHTISKTETPRSDIPNYLIKTYPPSTLLSRTRSACN